MAKALVGILLWVVVALCLFLTLVPPFLDRIYYRGAETGHFDGGHFANPDGDAAPLPATGFAFLARRIANTARQPQWPASVPVTPGHPPARVPARGLDWGQRLALRPGIDVVVTRNHHWSSRWFGDRNRALWSSFVVTLPGGNLFFAGDTGWGDGKWPAEAAAFGPIRFAAIPVGAFRFGPGQMAADAHIGPREAIQVWGGLGRPWALPIHWGTFRLSWEAYRTPPDMLAAMLRCGGTDPARFAEHPIGRSFDVPAIGMPPMAPNDDGIAKCRAEGRFDRFP